jgi:hypothetical protein
MVNFGVYVKTPIENLSPKWIRLDAAELISGLEPARHYALLHRGLLDTVVYRSKGGRRGVRLVSVESLDLRRLAAKRGQAGNWQS